MGLQKSAEAIVGEMTKPEGPNLEEVRVDRTLTGPAEHRRDLRSAAAKDRDGIPKVGLVVWRDR